VLKQVVENMLGKADTAPHGYQVSGIVKFMQLDTEAIRVQLGVEESAVLRGRQNLPKSDSDVLDETERSIINKIGEFRQNACTAYDEGMKGYENLLRSYNFHARSTEITSEVMKAEADFDDLYQCAFLELTLLRDERDRARLDLQNFREKNRLSREVSLPKFHPFLSYMILFFILSVETVFNGMFFGERVAGGLIEGFSEATLFALNNVVFGYMSGYYAVPNLLHVRTSRQVIGGITLLLFFVILTLNNLFAAHYRAVLVGDVNVMEAARLALKNMTDHPFSVGDGKSFQLMGFGFLCSIFAGMKGWAMDDPYPGYGNKSRLYMTKVEDFITFKKERLNEVTDSCHSAAERMKTSLTLLEQGLSNYKNRLDTRLRFYDEFIAHLDHLETVANDLLTSYRQKNAEIREDAAPAYFQTPYVLPRPNVTSPQSEEGEVATRAEILREVTAQLQIKLVALHDGRKSAMSQLVAIG